MTLEDKLQRAGFLKNEVVVYIAILSLGKASLTQITEKARLNKVNTLDKLNKLAQKGLVTREDIGRESYYTALPPKQTMRKFLHDLDATHKEKESYMLDSLEGLEIHYNSQKDMPEVKFVEGPETVNAIHTEVQNTEFDEMLEFTNLDAVDQAIPPTLRRQHRSALKTRRNKSRCIYTSKKGAILSRKFKQRLRYFIPKEKYDFDGEISTFGDKIVLVAYNPRYLTVIIRNKSIAMTMKAILNLAWETAEKYNKVGLRPFRRARMNSPHSLSHKPSPVNQTADGESLKRKHNDNV